MFALQHVLLKYRRDARKEILFFARRQEATGSSQRRQASLMKLKNPFMWSHDHKVNLPFSSLIKMYPAPAGIVLTSPPDYLLLSLLFPSA